jgi:hypothetical protein
MPFPGRDEKLLEQLALAKEAGTKGMAKEFFAPTPGSGGPPADAPAEEGAEAAGAMPPDADDSGAMPPGAAGGELTPEQLQQLLAALGGAPEEPTGV